MTGPKLHPRERPVALAKANLAVAFWQAVDEHAPEITYVELLQVLSSLQESLLKDMLRIERHGDADKSAGWAYDEEEDDDPMCKCSDLRSDHSESGANCNTVVIDRPCECRGFRPVK